MSAGQLPSGPNFWDSNNRKIIFGVGGGAVVTSQVRHNHQENQHQKWMRLVEMNKGLNERSLNPHQFILRASDDGLSIHQIKLELVAWGKTWKGTNFADPEAFDVAEEWGVSSNPARRVMGLKNRSCHLKTRTLDVPTTRQEGKETLTQNLGLRGGSTEAMEVQQVTKNGIDVATGRYKYYPNLVSEVCAEQVEAVPDRTFTRTFTCTTPQEIGPIPSYLFGIVFGLTSVFLGSYLQEKFLKPAMSKNNTLRGLFGEEQKPAINATPQLLLEIFTSYQNKTISKAKAVYILVNFYNLSEREAIKLLNE